MRKRVRSQQPWLALFISGLAKLKKAAADVEALKLILEDEELELRTAEEACGQLMASLQKQSLEAEKEALAVAVSRETCEVCGCTRMQSRCHSTLRFV